MDSQTLLDYALFQLTPTRTRCDLLVFSGGISEKLASGLVEPFISHLKFAKDQIPKGGYSITLRPPTTDASWFTKTIFQRLVRFISTPEILERFVRIEREILQIESSVQSNEFSDTNKAVHAEEGSLLAADGIPKTLTDSTKLKGDGGANDVVQEENSKIRLQRLLETRKALLRKEQAMAYARALAAGFEMDNMDDLILFADTFGASRLREACTDFKELCKKKRTDGLWMDELAAMEAYSPSEMSYSGTSGIILTCESSTSNQNNVLNFHSNVVSTGKPLPNGSLDASSYLTANQANLDNNKDSNLPAPDKISSTSAKVQGQMPWPNQIPQFMYNFQSPVQQIPQFQGYPFHGMQPVPPYYPAHMGWPPNMDESSHGPVREPDYRRHQKSSSRKKGKSPNSKGPETSEEEEQIESSDTDSGNDSDAVMKHDRNRSSGEQSTVKKHRKKSLKTVVIRNINYITSKRRDGESDGVSDDSSSVEDELIDENSLKKKVDAAVGSLGKHHKSKSHNNKKRGAHQGPSIVNGSNGSPEQDPESDLAANISAGGKRNENWDTFQNLLMRDEEPTIYGVKEQKTMDDRDEHFTIKSSDDGISFALKHAVDLESEKVTIQQRNAIDSFVVTQRDGDFVNGEIFHPSIKRRDCADAQLLISQRLEESGSKNQITLSDFAKESSMIRNGKGEDWFIVNHSGRSEIQEATIEQTMFDGDSSLSIGVDRFHTETSKRIVPMDDSFMVQARAAVDDPYDSQWRTDISMAADLSVASQPEKDTPDVSQVKLGVCGAYEPDDVCMVPTRDSGLESVRASWTPEMDYGTEISFTETEKKSTLVETNDHMEEKLPMNGKSTKSKKDVGPGTNNLVKEARSKVLRGSLAKGNSDILSKTKKPSSISRPMVQKSKLEKEEEIRKRMEALLTQRQKRIAERTAASNSTPAASKNVPVGSKMTNSSKNVSSPKLGTTNSAKDQLVPGQIKHKGGSVLSKSDQLKKNISKVIGVVNA